VSGMTMPPAESRVVVAALPLDTLTKMEPVR
jgi:hypothetical protein